MPSAFPSIEANPETSLARSRLLVALRRRSSVPDFGGAPSVCTGRPRRSRSWRVLSAS